MLYYPVPGGFSDLVNQKSQNSNWKKSLGFRKMQEKLENDFIASQNQNNAMVMK